MEPKYICYWEIFSIFMAFISNENLLPQFWHINTDHLKMTFQNKVSIAKMRSRVEIIAFGILTCGATSLTLISRPINTSLHTPLNQTTNINIFFCSYNFSIKKIWITQRAQATKPARPRAKPRKRATNSWRRPAMLLNPLRNHSRKY